MEARNRPLPEWFNRIRTGQIRLPRFQREEAWSPSEVSSVLDSLLRDLPIGATLVLEVGSEEQFKSRPMVGAPPPTERVIEHLLDGQQRLTALWRSFHEDYDDRTYYVYFKKDEDTGQEGPRIYGQARWMKKGQRYPLWAESPKEVYSRGYIPLKILRPGDVVSELWGWCDAATDGNAEENRELLRKVTLLQQRVQAYNIPFLSLPSSTAKEVALDVFIKLNTSSVQLTAFDILVAQVEETTGESLHELVTTLKNAVPAIEAYVNPADLVLNVASLREDRAPNQASYQRLDLGRMVREWDRLTKSIAWAISLLEEERILDGSRLPTVAVLPVLAALSEHIPTSPDRHGSALTLIRKYLWRAFFTRRYESAAASAALQDFRGIRALLENPSSLEQPNIFDETQYPLPTLEALISGGWPKSRDTLARAILAVSLKAGARDLADDSVPTRGTLRKREYHHLFPDSLLRGEAGLSSPESSRALNCVLVSWKTNRTIAAKEPLHYLAERTAGHPLGEPEVRARLASHLVPFEELAVGGYNQITSLEAMAAKIREDYEWFLLRRAELFLEPIQALCSGRRWP